MNDVDPKTKKILQLLRLRQINMGVFLKARTAACCVCLRVHTAALLDVLASPVAGGGLRRHGGMLPPAVRVPRAPGPPAQPARHSSARLARPQVNKATQNMLQRVEPYVAYGYPNLKTVKARLVFAHIHGMRLQPAGCACLATPPSDRPASWRSCGARERARAVPHASLDHHHALEPAVEPSHPASLHSDSIMFPSPPAAGADLQARLWQGQQAAHPAHRQLGRRAGAPPLGATPPCMQCCREPLMGAG